LTTLGEVLSAAERSIAPLPMAGRSDNAGVTPNKTDDVANDEQVLDAVVERGKSDLAAVRRLYHDAELTARLQPDENAARAVFNALESVRIQYLGIRNWQGMRVNFSALFSSESKKIISEAHFFDRPGAKLGLACSAVVAERLLEIEAPCSIRNLLQEEIQRCETLIDIEKDELGSAAEDQVCFAALIHRTLYQIGLVQRVLDEEELRRRALDHRAEFDPSELIKKKQVPKQTLRDGDESEQEIGQALKFRPKFAEEMVGQSDAPYKPYTIDYDEIVHASDLLDMAELVALRSKLDAHLNAARSVIGILANRLQRRLQSLQQTSWDYDQEEGILDISKLTRIITDPALSASYKTERESELGSIVVCVLIDNSASMKGEPIVLAACCADILSQALERCGVKLEVLGFTTSQWNGGCSRQQWTSTREAMPGRLNDLRHIIYKGADERWRRCKTAFALMMKEDILKENIDGEAINWAYERLTRRYEEHRILLVVSDGAPADHSTLSLNGRDYLSDNLRKVVRRIENEGKVDLVGIGVGHDLSQIYKRSVRINSMSSLASVLTSELVSLFEKFVRKGRFA